MFTGEYNHSIDPKGRMIIPAKFRDELGLNFFVTKGLDGCLSIYTTEEWTKLAEKLNALPLTNKDARKFTRYMLSGAEECELDKMGRILIPQTLRDAAGLNKDVVVAGVGNRVEIWDKDKWTEMGSYDDMEEIAEHLEGLGI